MIKEFKKCKTCQKIKFKDEFPKYISGNLPYLRAHCSECWNKRDRDNYKNNPERQQREKILSRNQYTKHKEKRANKSKENRLKFIIR